MRVRRCGSSTLTVPSSPVASLAFLQCRKDAERESLSQEDRPRASLEGHRRIAEAVRQQDASAASRAMADHIRLVSDVALLRDAD